MAATLPNAFVMPMSVPACLGAMSMWLTWKPTKMAELKPAATTSRVTVRTFCSLPVKHKAANAAAGIKTPTNNK